MAAVSIGRAARSFLRVPGKRGGGGGRSVGADLRDLSVSRLVGGLDEHCLGELLSRRHRDRLNLIQLL